MLYCIYYCSYIFLYVFRSVLLAINHKNVYTIVLTFFQGIIYNYIYISQESKPLCRIELRGMACRLRSAATQRQSNPATLWFRSADVIDVGTGLARWHQGQRHKGDSRPQGAQCRQKNARYSTPKSWWYIDILMIWWRMFFFPEMWQKVCLFLVHLWKLRMVWRTGTDLCFTSVP